MSADAQARYKQRSPDLVREKTAANKKALRALEKEGIGLDDLPRDQITKRLYRKWTSEDVDRWFDRVKEKDAKVYVKSAHLQQLSAMDLVPNEPFRLAYMNVPTDMKKAVRGRICFELARLEREDGQAPNVYGSRSYAKDPRLLMCHMGVEVKEGKLRIFCEYKLAEACCRAMDLHPPECGI